jgi:hypothetical protein
MPNDAKNSTIMPIIIKVNSGATTKFVMKNKPIGENNKYSMVMCPICAAKNTKDGPAVGNYFDLA